MAALDAGVDEGQDEGEPAALDVYGADDFYPPDGESVADGEDGADVADALVCDDAPKVGCPCGSLQRVLGWTCVITYSNGTPVGTWAACDEIPYRDCPCDRVNAKPCCARLTTALECTTNYLYDPPADVWGCQSDACECDPGPSCGDHQLAPWCLGGGTRGC